MNAYRGFVTLFALAMIGLGLAMITITVVHGFGIGVVLGALFVAAGGGRPYLMRRPR
jgi:hypothetical protein